MSISDSFEEMFRKRFGRAPTQDELTVLIDQSVKSYNQSGGITAHTVNLGPQPRRIEDALKNEILTKVSRTHPISVQTILGDAEAFQFAQQIKEFLKANGFSLAEDGVSHSVFKTPRKGISFNPVTSTFIVGSNLL